MGSKAMRQTEDKTWMEVAKVIAARSRCDVKVGAVIVGADGRIQATGYNGTPPGIQCQESEEYGCAVFCNRRLKVSEARDQSYIDCPMLHSEINALLYSDQARRKGGIMYITKPPCLACAKAIANSGIVRVLLPEGMDKPGRGEGTRLLKRCGIMVEEVWS